MRKKQKATVAQLEILLSLQDGGKDARRLSCHYPSTIKACADRGWIGTAGNGSGEAWVYITPDGRGAIHRVLGVRAAPLLDDVSTLRDTD